MMQAIPSTPNVSLRPIVDQDAAAIADWMKDLDLIKMLGHNFAPTAMCARDWISAASRKGDAKIFGILLQDTNELIGITAVYLINMSGKTALTGTIIGSPQHRRKGYARQTREMIFKLAFEEMGLETLEAHVFPHNKPAISMLTSMGYIEASDARITTSTPKTLDDRVVFHITKETWRNGLAS